MAQVTQADIIKLYDVILDRTPDAKGLAHWEGQAKSMTLDKMAELFFSSREFKEMTKDLKPDALAKEVEKLKADLKVDSPEMNARVAFVEALIAKDKKLLGTLAANKTLESVWEGTDINEAVDTLANASVGFDIATLYVTILGRLPDAGGYAWYKNKMEKEGWTLDRIAKDFLKSSEFKKLYTTPEDFANAVETNKIFGKLSKEQKADLVKMATEKSGGDFVGFLTDNFDTFKDKAALASTFLENGKSDEKAIEAFKKFLKDGKADVAKKTLGITDDAPKATFKDDFKADATVSLTKDADALPEKGKDNSKNDLFKAVVSAFGSEATLNEKDKIDGGAGTDKLEVELKSNFGGFKEGEEGGYLKNVEKIELKNEATFERTFDATGVEGAKEYVLKGHINLKDLGGDVTKVALVDRSHDFKADYAADAVDGDNDTLELALYNVHNKDTAVKLTATGVETLKLQAAGKNIIHNATASTVEVMGQGSLTFTSDDKLTSFDASKATGKVKASLGNQTNLETIKLGAGSDTLELVSNTGLTSKVIEGGKGVDTLKLTGAGGNLSYEMTGVENLELAGVTGALVFDATKSDDLANVVVTAGVTDDVTLNSLGAKKLTLNLKGENTTTGKTISLDHEGATNMMISQVKDAGGENELNATLGNSTMLNLAVAEKMNYTGTITANAAKSVDVALKGKAETIIKADAAERIAIRQEAKEASTLTLDAGAATSLNIKANQDLTITATNLSKVNALNLTTEKQIILGDLTALRNATLKGVTVKDKAAEVTLAALGKADMEGAIDIKAGNLKNLTFGGAINTKGGDVSIKTTEKITGTVALTGAINTNATTGSVTLDLEADIVNGTAAITAGDSLTAKINSKKATLNNLTAKAVDLNITTTDKTGSNNGDATVGTITATESLKAVFNSAEDVSVGAVTATDGEAAFDITSRGNASFNAIGAKKLTLDLSKVKGNVTFGGDLSVGESLALTGPKSGFDLTTQKIKATGAALEATFTGSKIADDKMEIEGAAATENIKLKGDLGKAGTDAVKVAVGGTTLALNIADLAGAEQIKVTSKANDNLTLTFTGTTGNDDLTVVANVTDAADKLIKVGGDLGGGKDTVTVDASAATVAEAVKIDVSGVQNAEKVTIKLAAADKADKITLGTTKATIEGFQVGASKDALKIDGFTSALEIAAAEVNASDSVGNGKVEAGKVLVLRASEAIANVDLTKAADLAGNIGNGAVMNTAGGKAVIVHAFSQTTTNMAKVYVAEDKNSDQKLTADEITLVGVLTNSTNNAFAADAFKADNFVNAHA